nr:MAG TPA: hypothetical protein [Caudoviricetes sp.]
MLFLLCFTRTNIFISAGFFVAMLCDVCLFWLEQPGRTLVQTVS